MDQPQRDRHAALRVSHDCVGPGVEFVFTFMLVAVLADEELVVEDEPMLVLLEKKLCFTDFTDFFCDDLFLHSRHPQLPGNPIHWS